MKAVIRLAIAIVVCGVLGPAAPAAQAQAFTGELNLLLGAKLMSSDWDFIELDLSQQDVIGISASWGGAHWPIHIATDLLTSRTSDRILVFGERIKLEGSTIELDLGVRKIWKLGIVKPYLGGGLAIVNGKVEAFAFGESEPDDGTSLGGWLGGGAMWRIGHRLNLGLDARYSTADVEIFEEDFDAGGLTLAALIGFGW